jgi:FkbM family methyltransferase
MVHPSKAVQIGGIRRVILGLAVDDPYFLALRDGYGSGFDAFCAAVLRPDDICFDIGANIGLTSLIMAAHVPRGRVLSVEAGPTVFRLLQDNIARSGCDRVTPVHAAAGETDGTARFTENSAYGHISRDGVEVPLRTLSSLAGEHALPRVDFLKIDVEGHEFPILRAALDLLRCDDPVVFLEFNACCQIAHSAVNPLEFAQWLLRVFSHVWRVDRSDGELTLHRIPPDGALHLLHGIMVRAGTLTDLVATNAPERLTGYLAAPPRPRLAGAISMAAQRLLRRAGFELRRIPSA